MDNPERLRLRYRDPHYGEPLPELLPAKPMGYEIEEYNHIIKEAGAIFHDQEGNPLSALQASSIYEGRSPPTSTTPPPQPVEPRYPRRVETHTWKVEEEMSPQAGLSNSPQSYQEGGPSTPQAPWQPTTPVARAPTAFSEDEPAQTLTEEPLLAPVNPPLKEDDSQEELEAARRNPMFGGLSGRMEEVPQPSGLINPAVGGGNFGRQSEEILTDEERQDEARSPVLREEDETIDADDMDIQKPTGLGLDDESLETPGAISTLAMRANRDDNDGYPAIVPTYGQQRSGNPPGKIPASPGHSGSSGSYSIPGRWKSASTTLLKSKDGHNSRVLWLTKAYAVPFQKGLYLEGIASSTNLDRDGDVCTPTLLQDFLRDIKGGQVNLFLDHQHSSDKMLGQLTDGEIANGYLKFTAKLQSPETSPAVADVLAKLNEGFWLGTSIGGNLGDSHVGYDPKTGKNVRYLDHGTLYEVSVTPLPSNPDAQVLGVVEKNRRWN